MNQDSIRRGPRPSSIAGAPPSRAADHRSVRATTDADLICLSHLRWNFVYQRPQHLMSHCALHRRVFFFEEPIFEDVTEASLRTSSENGVIVATPVLPRGTAAPEGERMQRDLLQAMIAAHGIGPAILWYYTPMARAFTRDLSPACIVYDCMDELSLFRGAPPELHEREAELFGVANLVFTGGQSLYQAKRHCHPSVHAFPSSIDKEHFAAARQPREREPEDQARIPHPRLGFFGVLDERLDRDLLRDIAAARPAWHFCIIGPVVKIDESELPRAANIHYLGAKRYEELPHYLAEWDVALLLFAQNDSTKFISPTKTPEYLAAGKPVVSTPIADVIRPYGVNGLVRIAATAPEFVDACEQAMGSADPHWVARVDKFLEGNSWQNTWSRMERLIGDAIAEQTAQSNPAEQATAAAD